MAHNNTIQTGQRPPRLESAGTFCGRPKGPPTDRPTDRPTAESRTRGKPRWRRFVARGKRGILFLFVYCENPEIKNWKIRKNEIKVMGMTERRGFCLQKGK